MTISISQLAVSGNYSLMLLFFTFSFPESVKRGCLKDLLIQIEFQRHEIQ